jgi:hypothetical protein
VLPSGLRVAGFAEGRRPGPAVAALVPSGYYYFLGGGGDGFSCVLEEASASAPATAGGGAPSGRHSGVDDDGEYTLTVLFSMVVLVVVLLVSGLLHVLLRLFLKTHRTSADGEERQHLFFFPGHEDGSVGGRLGQAAIDALPEFAYAELSGAASALGDA